MRRGAGFGLVIIAAAFLSTAANAQVADEPLSIYAATILITPPLKEEFIANGVYLGNGAIITAAHAIGHWASLKKPRVIIAGQTLPAKIIKEGAADQTDLSILSVDPTRLPFGLGLRRNPLCKQPSVIGQKVVVVGAQQTNRSRILSPAFIEPSLRKTYTTLISDLAGTSGSGVFDARKGCMFGIITKKITKFEYRLEEGAVVTEENGLAGYFIPAPEVRDFLPAELRF